jgi:uncharacterized membrane protein AbrB (regulator of aidB expression)
VGAVSLDVLETLIQGILALALIAGAIVLTVIQVMRGQSIVIPDWLSLATGAVIGYFFGTRFQRNPEQPTK